MYVPLCTIVYYMVIIMPPAAAEESVYIVMAMGPDLGAKLGW